MTYVYDSSYIAALVIPDEKNPKIDNAHDSLEENDEILIPQLFWYEAANIFMNLIRRKRFSKEEVNHLIQLLTFYNLTTDFEYNINFVKKLWNLCIECNLSSYDAAYLELAERKRAVFCTMDDNLRAIAKKRGLEVI